MPKYDEENFSYGANLRRGIGDPARAAEAGRRGGKPATTRKIVHQIVQEAAEDGADMSPIEIALELVNRKRGKQDLRNAHKQVNKILPKLEAEGKVERQVLSPEERYDRGLFERSGGRATVWKIPGTQQHTPDTVDQEAKDAWERRMDRYRAGAPENRGRQVRSSGQPKPQKESWVDKQARLHKERLEAQRDNAPENKGRRGRGGRSSGGGQQGRSFVEDQRSGWEQKMAAERAKSEGQSNPHQGKSGKDPGKGTGFSKPAW